MNYVINLISIISAKIRFFSAVSLSLIVRFFVLFAFSFVLFAVLRI